jgi:thiol-disulfide isomerase/thioredoxin
MRGKLLLVALVATSVAGAGWKPRPAALPNPQRAEIAVGEIGSRLPDFSLKDLRGKELSSADFKGKVVLVDFWATWCQPCKKEMPGYQKLLDTYGNRGLAVVGFKFDTMADTEDPVRFAHRIGVRYPLAVASGRLRQAFGGVEGLPTTLLYDRHGILRQKIIGFEYTSVVESDLKPLL